MRRTVVRQKVLKQCLEMRKRKIVDGNGGDPAKPQLYGQYGGKPLWAMSRDIDRVIADNHPRVRRLKRVEEAMRSSLENGTILDQEAVSRRIETFFHLKKVRQHRKDTPPALPDVFKGQTLRRNPVKPPSWAVEDSNTPRGGLLPSLSVQPAPAAESRSRPSKPDSQSVVHKEAAAGKFSKRERPSLKDNHRPGVRAKEPSDKDTARSTDALGAKDPSAKDSGPIRHPEAPLGVTNKVSLDLDSKGRLRGIRTNLADTMIIEEERVTDQGKPKNVTRNETIIYGRTGKPEQADDLTDEDHWESYVEEEPREEQPGDSKDKPRSKLILPPIESSKALVSKH